jgi:methyl-accepting chemotaxis protein
MIDDSEDINISNDDDLKLPLEKRVELKKYVEDLRKVVEDEEDIDALKNFFNEEIENTKVQIETIYLANKNEIYLITPYVQLPDNYDPNVRPWYESAIKENIYISISGTRQPPVSAAK